MTEQLREAGAEIEARVKIAETTVKKGDRKNTGRTRKANIIKNTIISRVLSTRGQDQDLECIYYLNCY